MRYRSFALTSIGLATALMVLFIAGNLVSAIAPTYEVLLLGRILAQHGAVGGEHQVMLREQVRVAGHPGVLEHFQTRD